MHLGTAKMVWKINTWHGMRQNKLNILDNKLFSTATNLGGESPSDNIIVSQSAIKSYIDNSKLFK